MIPIGVSLRQETLDRLSAASKDVAPAEALAARASAYFENLVDGGMLLTPDQVKAIETAASKPVRNGADVVAAAQKGIGLEDGGAVFSNRIDPSFMPPLEERAKECGRPVRELLSDLVDYALENNWLYGLEFEGKRRTFSPANENYLSAELGDNFTVDALVAAFKQLKRQANKSKRIEEPEPVGV